MTRAVSFLVGLALILGTGGFAYWQTHDAANLAPNTNVEGSGSITAADVAMHADAANCWAIINNNVYDLTSWIPQHPGGSQAIVQLCGSDGSEKFNNKHGGMEPMTGILAGFKIGVLSQ